MKAIARHTAALERQDHELLAELVEFYDEVRECWHTLQREPWLDLEAAGFVELAGDAVTAVVYPTKRGRISNARRVGKAGA